MLLAARLITLTLRQVCSTLNVNLQILVRVMENNFFPEVLSITADSGIIVVVVVVALAVCSVRCCLTYNQPTI